MLTFTFRVPSSPNKRGQHSASHTEMVLDIFCWELLLISRSVRRRPSAIVTKKEGGEARLNLCHLCRRLWIRWCGRILRYILQTSYFEIAFYELMLGLSEVWTSVHEIMPHIPHLLSTNIWRKYIKGYLIFSISCQ